MVNTQDAFQAGTNDLSTTSVADPANQAKADALYEDARRRDALATSTNDAANKDYAAADRVADTNPSLSRTLTESGDRLRKQAILADREAVTLQETAESIDPTNQ